MTVSLPEELVSEILARLPAKSLMRFKSVEKSWNTLFKTNSFIRRQREWRMGTSSSFDEEGERFMMFYTDQELETIETVPPEIALVSYDQLQLQHLQYPVTHPDHDLLYLFSLGHCNGIFCLQATFHSNTLFSRIEDTILWNPATRDVKFLPPIPSLTPPSISLNILVSVYNTNTDSWTVVHDFDANGVINLHTHPSLAYEAYSNGVFHWLSSDYTYILCFDFHSNKFRKINTPSTMSFSSILEASDCIAYLVYDKYRCDNEEFNVRIEIWNLKQDSSWVKVCNFEPLDSYISIHAIWKDGTEFLGGSGYHALTIYNSRAQPLRQLEIFAEEFEFHIYPYVESIAPLSL